VLGAGGSILLLPLLIKRCRAAGKEAISLSLVVVIVWRWPTSGPYLRRRQVALPAALGVGDAGIGGKWIAAALVKAAFYLRTGGSLGDLRLWRPLLVASWCSPGVARPQMKMHRTHQPAGRCAGQPPWAVQGVLVVCLPPIAGVVEASRASLAGPGAAGRFCDAAGQWHQPGCLIDHPTPGGPRSPGPLAAASLPLVLPLLAGGGSAPGWAVAGPRLKIDRKLAARFSRALADRLARSVAWRLFAARQPAPSGCPRPIQLPFCSPIP